MFLSAQVFAVFFSSILPRSAVTLPLCLAPVLMLLIFQNGVGADYQSYYSFFQSDYFGPFERRQEWLSVAIFKIAKLTELFQVSLFIFYTISILALSHAINRACERKIDRIAVLFLIIFAANFLVNHLNLVRYLTALSLWMALFFSLQYGRKKLRLTDWGLFLIPGLLHASTLFLTLLFLGYSRFNILKWRWVFLAISLGAIPIAQSIFMLFEFYEPLKRYSFEGLSFAPISKIYLVPIFLLNFFVFFYVKGLDKNSSFTRLLGFSLTLTPLTFAFWESIGERASYFIILAQCFCCPFALSKLNISRNSRVMVSLSYFAILLIFTFYKFLILAEREYDYQIILAL